MVAPLSRIAAGYDGSVSSGCRVGFGVYQGFKVVPLGLGILLGKISRRHRQIYWFYWGPSTETFQGYDLRGTTEEPLSLALRASGMS